MSTSICARQSRIDGVSAASGSPWHRGMMENTLTSNQEASIDISIVYCRQMRFQVHNQLAGLAICATRLFHSACQSILQSILQNSGHREQMSNTQTSTISQSMSSWILRFFLLRQLLCSSKKLCSRVFEALLWYRHFHCAVHLLSQRSTAVAVVVVVVVWSSEVNQHNTLTQWPWYFFPLCLFY